MRAVLCTAFEGIKSLIIGETAEPSPKPDEMLIDVYAASVSYMDYLMIWGLPDGATPPLCAGDGRRAKELFDRRRLHRRLGGPLSR
jgi:NADPH:quinone reductase-like Zn-dependent oxidoreductase